MSKKYFPIILSTWTKYSKKDLILFMLAYSCSCSQVHGLTSLNYIICNLGIGPRAFNIDMGLGWTSRVFKMKSYGHSQSCSVWQKH